MINTILFAADMGVHTSYLLHHVNSTALKYDARVVVLHIVEPAALYLSDDAQRAINDEALTQIIDQVRLRIIDALEDEFMDGHQGLLNICDVRVLFGKPTDIILAQALDCSADMIIVGSHDGEVAGENMLGSVTSKVLQMSRIPVYMVPLIRHVVRCT